MYPRVWLKKQVLRTWVKKRDEQRKKKVIWEKLHRFRYKLILNKITEQEREY